MAVSSPTATSGQVFLVTDEGRRYAVPDADVLGALGFADVSPVVLPESLVARVPAGPALDPQAARGPS